MPRRSRQSGSALRKLIRSTARAGVSNGEANGEELFPRTKPKPTAACQCYWDRPLMGPDTPSQSCRRGPCCCLRTALFSYLEQRGADLLIAVKHSRHKSFQVIKDRLTYGRKAPLQASKRERKHGRDITWTLRTMPAPDWVVEN